MCNAECISISTSPPPAHRSEASESYESYGGTQCTQCDILFNVKNTSFRRHNDKMHYHSKVHSSFSLHTFRIFTIPSAILSNPPLTLPHMSGSGSECVCLGACHSSACNVCASVCDSIFYYHYLFHIAADQFQLNVCGKWKREIETEEKELKRTKSSEWKFKKKEKKIYQI